MNEQNIDLDESDAEEVMEGPAIAIDLNSGSTAGKPAATGAHESGVKHDHMFMEGAEDHQWPEQIYIGKNNTP